MERNEIKKEIYRQKPNAKLSFIRMGVAYYYAHLGITKINFEVPVEDMGTADFTPLMEAKLMLRWLI